MATLSPSKSGPVRIIRSYAPPVYPSSPAAGPDGSKMSKQREEADVVKLTVSFIITALIFVQ